jgi:hypothetical protein
VSFREHHWSGLADHRTVAPSRLDNYLIEALLPTPPGGTPLCCCAVCCVGTPTSLQSSHGSSFKRPSLSVDPDPLTVRTKRPSESDRCSCGAVAACLIVADQRRPGALLSWNKNPRVLGGGLEGDLVAEGLELGDGSLAGPGRCRAGEEVGAKVLVVAVLSEQVRRRSPGSSGPGPSRPSSCRCGGPAADRGLLQCASRSTYLTSAMANLARDSWSLRRRNVQLWQQNTNTRKLTEEMLDGVFFRARELLR